MKYMLHAYALLEVRKHFIALSAQSADVDMVKTGQKNVKVVQIFTSFSKLVFPNTIVNISRNTHTEATQLHKLTALLSVYRQR